MLLEYLMKALECHVSASISVLQTLHMEYSTGYILLSVLCIKQNHTHGNRMNMDIKT